MFTRGYANQQLVFARCETLSSLWMIVENTRCLVMKPSKFRLTEKYTYFISYYIIYNHVTPSNESHHFQTPDRCVIQPAGRSLPFALGKAFLLADYLPSVIRDNEKCPKERKVYSWGN
jgi:hypothetical protein